MVLFLKVVLTGLTLGSIYGLVALGYVIVYKATKVLNFALGDTVMMGALVALVLHVDQELPYVATVLIVLGLATLLGVIIERVASRPLLTAPHFAIILATAAIGEIMRSIARIWRGQETSYFPPILSRTPVMVGEIPISPLGMGIVGISIGVVFVFLAFFRYTNLGKSMRAASQNLDLASLIGIDGPRTFSVLWGVSAAFAAVAGILIAPLVLITPEMGVIANKAFVAAVLGGFTSIPGAVVGGLLWGVLENLVGVYISTAFKDVVAFAVLVVVLLVRPAGLFGEVERTRV